MACLTLFFPRAQDGEDPGHCAEEKPFLSLLPLPFPPSSLPCSPAPAPTLLREEPPRRLCPRRTCRMAPIGALQGVGCFLGLTASPKAGWAVPRVTASGPAPAAGHTGTRPGRVPGPGRPTCSGRGGWLTPCASHRQPWRSEALCAVTFPACLRRLRKQHLSLQSPCFLL